MVCRRDRPQVLSVKDHTAVSHLDMVLEQILKGQGRHALAASRLTDDSDDLSLSNRETDTVDHLVRRAALVQRDRHMFYFENILIHTGCHLPFPLFYLRNCT